MLLGERAAGIFGNAYQHTPFSNNLQAKSSPTAPVQTHHAGSN
jgi:hypothetical protein